MIGTFLRYGTIILLLLSQGLVVHAQDCLSAGLDASTLVCTTNSPFSLITRLGGSPDVGGSWQAPGGAAHGNTFDPAIHPVGIYTYTIAATNDCPASSAELDVSTLAPPNAGTSASITVCSDQAPFNMRMQLGGSPPAGGVWTDPNADVHVSTFDPATDISGIYTYTISGQNVCDDGVATLTVNKVIAPDAGINGTLSLCSNSAPTLLFNSLGGTPDTGGTWSGPNGPHSGNFNPATHPPGVYTYTVTGNSPCEDDSATVTVTVNQQPNAGTNGSITVCSNNAPFSLFAQLGGSPNMGGAWTGPGGGAVTGTYTPGTSAPGIYTYTVLGQPPCTSATATVTVTQITAANAGQNASITICSDQAVFPLISQLNGNPTTGGSWVGPNGPHGANFNPAVHPGGAYTYTVTGTSPCANASAVLTITVRPVPNAGSSTSAAVCSNDGSIAMITLLGGSPQSGGSWTGPSGQPHSGTFVPGTSAPGAYVYTVVGQSPCEPATATLTMSVSTAPDAGSGGSLVHCSSDASFSLFSALGGDPDGGGTWTGPEGTHSGPFTPGEDPPGAYTYTVTGAPPCANATAVLNISVINAPDAGTNGSTVVCGNAGQFDLLTVLGGSPSVTGTWTAPGGGNSNGIFIPGTTAPGVFTYSVQGQTPCGNDQATATIDVQPPPNAGTNGSITVCSNAAAVDLFSLLGGTPTSGGTWTRPNGTAHNGTYLPTTQPGGAYTYSVAGIAPCANATATVQVTRVIAPRAGTDGTMTVCSTNGPFQLINALGGNPDGGGSWSNSSGASVTGTFTPGTTPAGVFTYVVTGTAPCTNDSSQVTVVVTQAPNAGTNGTVTVCSSTAPFQLLTVLGGSPDPAGVWTGPNGQTHSTTFTPGTSVNGGYTYTVTGQTPCLNASAVAVVNVDPQPQAGTNGSFTSCATDPPVDLMTILGGTPDLGGTWSGPGPLTGSTFTPGTSAPGVYAYTVAGSPACGDAVAQVTANVNAAPNAGTGGDLTICQNAEDVNLFTLLSGTPDPDGTWSDDNGTNQLSGHIFSPTGLAQDTYSFTYTVPGIGQCASATGVVLVTIAGTLNAGTDGVLSVCGNNDQVNLFTGLNGSPQTGGTWVDVSGSGAQTGQFFNATFVQPGTYEFSYGLTGTVSCASASATVTVNVTQAPNAGLNGAAQFCSDATTSVPLFPYLGGNPTGGGTWTAGVPVSGSYNPSTMTPATFTYTVGGSGPCLNAQANVTVTETPAPNPGVGGPVSVCSNSAPFNMTALLTGNPQPGTWSYNGDPHVGSDFVPGLNPSGVYVYTVQGQFPCTQRTSSLTITVVPESNAGSNGSHLVCSSDPSTLLLSLMNGAQFGGSWIAPNNSVHPTNLQYVPGTSEPGEYRYVVAGNSPCAADTASLLIFQNDEANAGDEVSVTFCSNGPTVDLLSVIPGNPDPTGYWDPPGSGTFDGTFVPGVSSSGPYLYIVEAAEPCTTDTTTVTVSIEAAPNAGTSDILIVCGNADPFSMVDSLNGTPQLNGNWYGPLPSTTPHNGTFFPGGGSPSVPGVYVYVKEGISVCPADTATLEVIVNPAPNAGTNANLPLCSNSGSQDLFPLLGPNAQQGGTWSGPSNISGTFDPAVHLAGDYTYTVTGLSPCNSHSAQITVIVNQQPNAGCNGFASICDSDNPIDLFGLLNCSPQTNGNWTDPDGQFHTGTFLPGVHVQGIYTYTKNGAAPCANATAQVTIIQNEAPDAGGNGVVQICSDEPPFELFDHLTDDPDSGGSWLFSPGNTTFSGTYTPGTSQAGTYIYHIDAIAPCINDSSQVIVIESTASNVGCNSVAEICSSQAPFDLIELLGCSPSTTGSWTFNGEEHGAVFDPGSDVSGAYVYTILGTEPCEDAVSQVQVTLWTAPSAGENGSETTCVDDPSINLFTVLGTTADPGGSWTNINNAGSLNANGILNATGVAPGTYSYRYIVGAQGPCVNDTAFVTLQITTALDAGEDASIDVCESQVIDLFTALGGTPQTGGIWQDVDDSNALIGGSVFVANMVPIGSTWRFDHIKEASALCESDTARVTVTVVEGPYAGFDGQISVCSSDAPTALAPALLGGPDSNGEWFHMGISHSGDFDPTTDPPGVYTYVVPAVGSCPADSATVTVSMLTAVNAGEDNEISICSSDAAVPLFPLLGPSAETGGSWSFAGAHTGVYTPATDSPGEYCYTVPGPLPCPNAIACITVTEPLAPNAGCNASINICSNEDPIPLLTFLGCGPQTGGTWYDQEGEEHGDHFDPSSDQPGEYEYVILGTEPCGDASASLFIAVTLASNPGTSTTVDACITQNAIDLLLALGPLAEDGGNWEDVDTSNALSGDQFDPSMAGIGEWDFIYSFPANGPCAAQTSTVTVSVTAGANAGQDSSVTVCGYDQGFDLFGALGGNPDPGGDWQDLTGTGALLPGGILNAQSLTPGTTAQFGYQITDPGCGMVSAIVTVTISEFSDPGGNGEIILCITSPQVELFPVLTGSPETGGTWTGPTGSSHGSTFIPGTHQPGIYTYSLPATEHCPIATSQVNVQVQQPPNAGTDGVLITCDSVPDLILLYGLEGDPEQGGTWTDLDGVGSALTNGLLNTTLLAPGEYHFVYTITNAACGSGSAALTVQVNEGIEIGPITRECITIDRKYVVSFEIMNGDPSTYSVTGIEGSISQTSPYIFISDPIQTNQGFSGTVSDAAGCAILEVSGNSPCSFEDDIFIPDSFSPNDDGINDKFVIPGIDMFPLNKVVIFNRWGNKMFEAAGYDNQSVIWDGTSPSAIIQGKAPAGTYFYVIELGDETEAYTGYIYLNR